MRLRPMMTALVIVAVTGIAVLFAFDTNTSAGGPARPGGITISPCTLSDDSFEDNDTQETASPVSLPFSETNLCSRSGDGDWFSFSVSQGGLIQIDATFTHAGGDINVKLRDPSGAQVAFAISATDDEKIAHTALTSGIYRVLVELWQGSSNDYDLEISATCPPASGSGSVFSDALQAPLDIPDDDPAGVENCITVSDTSTINDLDVALDIGHTWVGDLVVTLTHKDTGTSATLVDRPGKPLAGAIGCPADSIDVTLDDEALSPVHDKCNTGPPAIFGAFRPNEPLSAFDGESLAGTWTLRVSDNNGEDFGALNGWSLIAGSGDPAPTPTSIAPVPVTPLTPFGDVDDNGTVNAIDAALILQFTAGLTGTLPNLAMGDVDDDDAVTAIDAALVLQFVAHLIDHL